MKRASGNRCTVVLLVLLAVCRVTPAVSQNPPELSPIWTLDASDGEPSVLRNDFASSDLSFPLPAILVRESRKPEAPSLDPMGVPYVAILPISPSGEAATDLQYIPSQFVVLGPRGTDLPTVIGAKVPDAWQGYVSTFDPLAAALVDTVVDFRPWCPAPREGTGVLFATRRTVVLRDGRDILDIPQRGYGAAYSTDARFGVVALLELPPGRTEPSPRGDPGRLVVFDDEGRILQEMPFDSSYPGHLYVSNDGRWVMATQTVGSSIASDRVLVLDVASGDVHYSAGLEGGYRYHSGDGRYLAEVQTGWGIIKLFDMATPQDPIQVSTFHSGVAEQSGMIVSAAINQDGSLIAARIIGSDWQGNVVLFDRSMRPVAVAPRHEDSDGVTFVGNLLLVGVQWSGPGVDLMPSTHVDLYSVDDLR